MGAKIIGLSLALLCSVPAYARQQGSWGVETTGPGASGASVAPDGTGYALVGSYSMNRYDPATNVWTPRTGPYAWSNFSRLVNVGGTLYWFVGSVYRYSAAANSWSVVGGTTNTREAYTATVLNGKVYLCGGWDLDGVLLNLVEEFDPTTRRFTQKAPLPVASSDAAAGAAGGFLCYAGGYDDFGLLRTNYRYDSLHDTWTRVADLPAPVASAGSFVVRNRFYVAGGSGATTYLTTNYAYDARTNSWSSMAPMLVGRTGLQAAEVLGKAYAWGGGTASSGSTLNHEYTPPPVTSPAPAVPSSLFQKRNGTHIEESDWIGLGPVTLGATLSDPDPTMPLSLEVEFVAAGGAFTGTPTAASSFEVAGVRSFDVPNLAAGGWQWRGRTRNWDDAVSAWVEFGIAGWTDFTIDATAPGIPFQLSPVQQLLDAPSGAAGMDVTFSWLAATDNGPPTLTYDLELNYGTTPVTLVAGIASTSTRFFVDAQLGHYYWRVRANDGRGNVGPWSALAPFRIIRNDGVDHGAGDAKAACGMSATSNGSIWMLILGAGLVLMRRMAR